MGEFAFRIEQKVDYIFCFIEMLCFTDKVLS